MAKSCPPPFVSEAPPGTPDEPPPGAPRYRDLELLGQGGMGRVFRAWDTRECRWVALKTVRRRGSEDLRHLEREIRLLAQVRHEGIVRLHDVQRQDEEIFFTMELLRGLTLEDFLRTPPPRPEEIRWVLGVAVRVTSTLEHIHELGWIHGDVKPSNIFVELPPETPLSVDAALAVRDPSVKLVDFGLARSQESLRKLALPAAGTPLYMAPEQIEGALEVDGRADLYALGVVLYHLVAREPPFRTLQAVRTRSPAPRPPCEANPSCPPALSDAILELMAREPHLRPSSAGEVREILLSMLEPSRRAETISPRLLSPVFVGRREEVAAVLDRLRSAAAGTGQLIRVAGETGSGKTWILEQGGIRSAAALDLGMLQASGTCRADAEIYGGLREMVRELAWALKDHLGGRDVPDPFEPAASLPISSECDDAATRSRLLQESILADVLTIIRDAAGHAPLLLTLENIHAADDLEIDLTARIAGALEGIPVALLVSYRPERVRDTSALARWLAELAEAGAPPPIELRGLADREVEELAGAMLRPAGPVSTRVVEALARQGDGRPSAIVRALRTLWERGSLRREGAGWGLAAPSEPIDRTAAAEWRERLRRLDRRDAVLVIAVAVLAVPADEELVSRVLGRSGRARHPERLRSRLRSIVRRGLLREDSDGYLSPDDLDDATLEQVVPPGAIRRLHSRAADALSERYGAAYAGRAMNIGEHHRRAGNRGKALDMFLAAARYSSAMFANRRGIDAYHRALDLCDDPDSKRTIAEELGELHARVGEYPVALQSFALASAPASGPVGDLDLLDKIGRVLHRQGDLGEALSVFSKCLERAPQRSSSRARALFRIGGVHLDRGDPETARRYLEESVEIYGELGDHRQMAAAQSGLGVVEKHQDRFDLAILHFEAALKNAERSDSPIDVATTLNNLGNIHRALGNDQAAVDCLRRSIEVRQRVGDRQGLAICLNNMARVHAFRGEIHQAYAATDRALAVFREIGDKKGVLIAGSNLGELAHIQGDFPAALGLFLGNLELAERIRLQRLYETNLCNLADLELDRGNHEESVQYARRCLRSLEDGRPTELRAQALGTMAAAEIALGDHEAAADALRDAEDIATELRLRERPLTLAGYRIRLCLERGEPDQALAAARPFLKGPEAVADRYRTACFHREVGRMYRELGPDWADLTEKYLIGALRTFDSMGSPHQASFTRMELAVYWRFLGEDDEVERLLRRAAEDLERVGLTRRIEELERLRGTRRKDG